MLKILANGNTTGGTDLAVSTGDDITFADSSKAIFGAGSDLQIYHDGSHSYIRDDGTGQLKIMSDGDGVIFEQSDGANTFKVNNVGETELFYSTNQKLATTNTGIDVTGSVTADGLTVDGGNEAVFNAPTTNDYLSISQLDTESLIKAGNDSGGSGVLTLQTTSGGVAADRLNISSGGDISFYEDTGTTPKLVWKSADERLGIGTASPSAKFHLFNTDNVAGVYSENSNASFTDSGLFVNNTASTGGNLLRLRSLGVDKLVVLGTGNVGIGTSTPTQKLDIHGAVRFGTTIADVADGGRPLIYASNGTGAHTGHALVIQARDGAGSEIDFVTGTTPTTRMRIDSSGNVGIGTSPSSKLDINISTNARGYFADSIGEVTAGTFCLQVANSANTALKPLGFRAEDIRFATGSSERMRIDASGNLGLGVTPSAWSSVTPALQILNASIYGYGNYECGVQANLYYDAAVGWIHISTAAATQYQQASGVHTWLSGSSASAGATATMVTNMTLDASGNLGIGTSPTAVSNYKVLHLQSDHASAGGLIRLQTNAASEYADIFNFNDSLYKDANTQIFRNKGGSTEYMRIDASGNLLVGTTSQGYGLFTSSRVTLGDGDAGDGFCVGGLNENLSAYTVQADNDTGPRYFAYIANGSSAAVGTISFTSTATAYNTSSDQRLKGKHCRR